MTCFLMLQSKTLNRWPLSSHLLKIKFLFPCYKLLLKIKKKYFPHLLQRMFPAELLLIVYSLLPQEGHVGVGNNGWPCKSIFWTVNSLFFNTSLAMYFFEQSQPYNVSAMILHNSFRVIFSSRTIYHSISMLRRTMI